MPRRSSLLVFTIAITAMASCSGDDDVASTTTGATDAATSSVATTTEPAESPSTTVAPTTAVPTTAGTTAPPPSSIETVPLTFPSTTAVPLDGLTADERAVVEAVLEAFRLYNELRLDPTNDALYEEALARLTGAARVSGQQVIDEYRELGQRGIPFPGAPASITPYLDTVRVDPDAGTGSVEVCWLNSNILVEIGTGEGGGDRVINDIISAVNRRYDVTLLEGEWLVSDIENRETFEGALTCDES